MKNGGKRYAERIGERWKMGKAVWRFRGTFDHVCDGAIKQYVGFPDRPCGGGRYSHKEGRFRGALCGICERQEYTAHGRQELQFFPKGH